MLSLPTSNGSPPEPTTRPEPTSPDARPPRYRASRRLRPNASILLPPRAARTPSRTARFVFPRPQDAATPPRSVESAKSATLYTPNWRSLRTLTRESRQCAEAFVHEARGGAYAQSSSRSQLDRVVTSTTNRSKSSIPSSARKGTPTCVRSRSIPLPALSSVMCGWNLPEPNALRRFVLALRPSSASEDSNRSIR